LIKICLINQLLNRFAIANHMGWYSLGYCYYFVIHHQHPMVVRGNSAQQSPTEHFGSIVANSASDQDLISMVPLP